MAAPENVTLYAVTTEGNIIKVMLSPTEVTFRCLRGNMRNCCGKKEIPDQRIIRNLVENCVGFGESYGLVLYERVRPKSLPAEKMKTTSLIMETGEIFALTKNEELSRWYSLGIRKKLLGFGENEGYMEESAEEAGVIIKKCLAFKERFVPDKSVLKKYKIE